MSRWEDRTARRTRQGAWLWVDLGLAGTILAVAALSGCILSPRSPEPPLASDVSWLQPSEPENVLANMESALEARYSTNYNDSLDDDFVFIQSETNVEEAPDGYFADFGKSREVASVEKLFSQVSAIALNWSYGDDDITIGPNTAEFRLPAYELTVTYLNGEEVIYTGYALLNLEKFGSEWRLVSWDESQNPSNQSWGRLRANLDV